MKLLNRVRNWCLSPISAILESQHDTMLRAEWRRRLVEAKNPLARCGAKYFSQNDEDGITLEIVRRLNIESGTFVELGVGNGLENNTLILLASGWKGVWVGGQRLAFDARLNAGRFTFSNAWVSLTNIVHLVRDGISKIGATAIDVLSLDLDGNDYYLVEELLKSGVSPKLFILEYNAKFPPPIKWTVKYDDKFSWNCSDYFGVSLALLCELLNNHSYTLVCCNAASGSNAFFIKDEYLPLFKDVPSDIKDIFVEPRYEEFKRWAHSPTARTVEQMLK